MILQRAAGRLKQIFLDHVLNISRRLVLASELSELHDAPSTSSRFRQGALDDVLQFSIPGWDTPPPVLPILKQRLAEGDLFFLAEDPALRGGIPEITRLYGWVTLARMEITSKTFAQLPADVAFSYRVYCHPHHRGKGVMPDYYSFLKKELQRRGLKRLWVTVDARNASSVRSHLKTGLKPIGSYVHFRLLQWEFAWISPTLIGR